MSPALIEPKTPWGYLGIIPLITGLVGICPLHTLFGIGAQRRTPIARERPH